MAGRTPITIVGNITEDPKLLFTQAGVAIVNLTVAHTPSHFDKSTNSWVDEPTTFMPVKAFRELAQHAGASFTKGSRVVVTGDLKTETWQAKDVNNQLMVDPNGQPVMRSKVVIEAEDIGGSVRYGTITGFQKAAPNTGAAAPVAQAAPQGQVMQPQGQPVQQFAPQGQPQQQQQFTQQAPQGQPVQQFAQQAPQGQPQQQFAPQGQPIQQGQPVAAGVQGQPAAPGLSDLAF
ncbi:single-stranded DNA-binding protein [Leucobacter sp. cx-169]|uniref:single-stranded DNA-binding protein n=1 Tax=Leucobacter sp. cx-169 TaxID=2770549 RepID=UPI00165DDFEB|nr:single-stranded DNA-binding protein [Leucobacter sp. cx-169]MBC9927273.1 single-stranded DNA-binding protein [Leucobacter sp. cx-169]